MTGLKPASFLYPWFDFLCLTPSFRFLWTPNFEKTNILEIELAFAADTSIKYEKNEPLLYVSVILAMNVDLNTLSLFFHAPLIWIAVFENLKWLNS